MDEKENETKSEESEHESEDESEILEESPCGRWLKRSEEVSQRNVPGIDRAYLAMDSEEGVEVVWNEVQFSERKSFKQQEEKIKAVFDNLMRIEHANIVKFHRYWIDYQKEQQKTRVVFITEYMSSGSVKEFLNKTKEVPKHKRTKSWKRWCTQILSALSYLHNCTPPVIHGNMTCDTIFIQHNGLVKIGSVAPDAIRNHVKTYHEVKRHMHYYAPEYEAAQNITPAVDIYSFGICALEMAVPRSQLHYTESKCVSTSDIERAIDVLDDPQQQDFIRLCLREDPLQRPSARSLLLHPLLFEVHSLKLLAAHAFVKNQRDLPEYKPKEQDKDMVIAETTSANPETKSIRRLKDVPAFDVEKFLEDVLNGVYPLTSFALPKPPWVPPSSAPQQTKKGQVAEGHTPSEQSEEIVPEARKIIYAQGTLMPMDKSYGLILQLRFEDKMNRHLNCEVMPEDTAETLANELAEHKLIREVDKNFVKQLLEDGLKGIKSSKSPVHFSSGHFLGSENTRSPLNEENYLLYSNLQNQILPKPHPAVNGMNPMMQVTPQQLPLFQSLPQTITSSPQSVIAPLLTSQAIPQVMTSTAPYQQAMLPQPTSVIDQNNMMPLTQPVLPLAAQGTTFLPMQWQFMSQPTSGAQAVSTSISSVPMLQAQLMQHQMLQQMQPGLYGQPQQNLLQQIQPQQILPQIPIQNYLPVQQNLSGQMTSQAQAAATHLTQPTVPNVQPMLVGPQTVVNPQAVLNPQLLQMQQQQQQLRMKLSQAGDIQRSTSLFSMQPQTQSVNNSNNTTFSRSVSRVDESGGQQILPQATPNSSIVSIGSSLSDLDSTNTKKSPPNSVETTSGKM